eukprot:5651776-Amphidinium_carterae.1
MEYMKHLGVWKYSTVVECLTETGRRPYGLSTEYAGSRLVVQETRGNSSIAVGDVMSTFAATPPLETL